MFYVSFPHEITDVKYAPFRKNYKIYFFQITHLGVVVTGRKVRADSSTSTQLSCVTLELTAFYCQRRKFFRRPRRLGRLYKLLPETICNRIKEYYISDEENEQIGRASCRERV